MGMALSAVGGLISLVCWIMTLVKMFQDSSNGGLVKGILGILCPLWAFIWSWMHGARNISLAWTVGIALSLIGNFVFGVAQ